MMRKTVVFLTVAALASMLVAALPAQQKVVNFKKLQEFLPNIDLPGFTKGKPGGQTSTVLGMSTSEATLSYEKSGGDNPPTIEVKISDMAGVPFGQIGASMMGATEFENQTETGYEKSVKIRGFPGTEKVDNLEDSKSAQITLFVGGRFMIELSGSGTSDIALLHKLLDAMPLGELAKVTQ
jgi:hypothetical protein